MSILIVSVILLLFYVLLISIYHIGWILIPYHKIKPPKSHIKFSILLPVRNEEKYIHQCLSSLVKQQYTGVFEILVIDDYSTDKTVQLVEEFIKNNPSYHIQLHQLSNHPKASEVKKAAITFGVSKSQFDYIILTDGDCVRGEHWLQTIHSFIEEKQCKMIYAPVMFNAENTFERIQALEFSGLVAIGGAAIRLKNPNMCSAANLVFAKQAFQEVGGYSGNENIASGDDEFLLHKVFKAYPQGVHFLKHKDAIVYTTSNGSLKQLAEQRKRWVSKSTKYENRYITAILVAAYLFNLSLIINLCLNFYIGLLLLGIKALVEGLFLFNVMGFFNKRKYLLLLPVAEIFHILYVIIIGIWANTTTYQWKERELK